MRCGARLAHVRSAAECRMTAGPPPYTLCPYSLVMLRGSVSAVVLVHLSVIDNVSAMNRLQMSGRSSFACRWRCAVMLLLIEAPISRVAVGIAQIIGLRRYACRAHQNGYRATG